MASKETRRKKKIVSTSERKRLLVYKSNKYLYGQIIDDLKGVTILQVSNNSKEFRDKIKEGKTKTEQSRLVGKFLAEKAKEQKIKKVIFDRNGFRYHGRIKAMAEGAREGGLDF
ncbi:MAG: 50S ribosomal protein L18 [Calditrichia bacterium]|nr:50S ribosomal protein L18 [Calditrichia bacterium]